MGKLIARLPLDPRQVSASSVARAVRSLARTPGMYRVYRAAAAGFFDWLRRRGLVEVDVALELPGVRGGDVSPRAVVVEPFLSLAEGWGGGVPGV